MGKAQTRAQNKYIAKRYDRINLLIEKDGSVTKDLIKAAADIMGESVNGFITRAIAETIKRDKEKQRKAPKPTPPDQMKLEDINHDKESHK